MPIGLGTAAAIAGGISALGSMGASAMSAKAAKEMQKRQIEWERERATNAHQWEIQDLKAAGLNPILSADGGGAVTGGVSAPMPDFSGIANAGNAVMNAINSAYLAKKTAAETTNIETTTANTAKDTELKEMQKGEVEANTILKMAETGLISEKTATEKIEQTLKKAQQANVSAETNAIITKLGVEVQTLQAQAAQLKAEKKYKEAATIEKQLNNKYYVLNLISNKLEQASRIGGNSASAFKNIISGISEIGNIVPLKKGIGFVANAFK